MKKIYLLLMMVVALGFAACEGEEGTEGLQGEEGQAGSNGADGAPALINVSAEAAGENCETGGFKVDVGSDLDRDGILDDNEITGSSFICNGASGQDGANGQDGVDGVDGQDGVDGSDGQDGMTFLIKTTEEAAGDNCPDGGFLVDSGMDDNQNGVLDDDEIDDSVFVCNGADLVNVLRGPLEPLVTTFGEFKSIAVETLISSLDTIQTSDGEDFNIGGSADGAGMVINPTTGNFELLVNFEDHYAVGRLTIDPAKFASDRTSSSDNRNSILPSIISADYLLNSSVDDFARQCSATMWESAIHGGTEDIFISASESWSNVNKGIDPYTTTITPDEPARRFEAMGQFGFENALPLPQDAYPGSTVIIGGDDDYFFFGNGGGNVTLYLSDGGDAEFDNGDAYVLRLAANEGLIDGEPADESDLIKDTEYAVEFVQMSNMPDTLDNLGEWDQAAFDVNALRFVRVEDLDYGKGSTEAGRTIYFAVTGRGPGRGTPNDWGTGYKLVLDELDPTQGTLTKILTGNLDEPGALAALQSPDNICVTENFIYWQEDPNSFARGHQAYIWQTALNGTSPKAVLQIDFNPALDEVDGTRDSDGFSGEFGALVDISDKVGEDGTFILCLQPHYWTNPNYAGIDGHDTGLGQPSGFAPREDLQGSQIVVLRGLER